MTGSTIENLNRVPGPEWDIFFDSSLHLGWVTLTVKLPSSNRERQEESFKNNCVERELAVILSFIFQK